MTRHNSDVGLWIDPSLGVATHGYQQIAAVAEIPGRDDPKIDILQLVYQWLRDPRNGRWVMVLDNAHDGNDFFGGNGSNERGPLVRLLPQAVYGSMLITSRNGLAARNLVFGWVWGRGGGLWDRCSANERGGGREDT